jgi:hypothetical protein
MNELSDRFLNQDETFYAEKVDSAGANTGFKRIEIKAYVKSQRIDFVRVYFTKNAKADSSDIQVGNVSGVFSKIIDDMPAYEYIFSLVSFDKYGNRSLPYELSGKVVGDDFRNMLVNRPLSSVNISGSNLTIGWGGAPSYALWTEVIYTNTSNQPGTLIVSNEETSTVITDFGGGRPKYNTLFLPDETSIDTLTIDASNLIIFKEPSILAANGVTAPTEALLDGTTSLTYPLTANSLADLVYFPNLKTLDLTGSANTPLTSLIYSRNDVVSTVGGGEWSPCIRKINNIADGATLAALLESGSLEKVRYSPHSMGLDDILAPYVQSGIVELETLPDEVLMPNQFNLNGVVQDASFTVDITYPATDAPNAAGLSEIYKVVVVRNAASVVFALPMEYKFNVEEYPYLKLKVYAPPASVLSGAYAAYQRLWFRFMNYMWAFTQYNIFGAGQQSWATGTDEYRIPDDKLETWYDITVSLSRALNTYNNNIIINIGSEANPSPWEPPLIQYYFANIRFSKNP